jgi:hypothetical protein
LGRPGRGKPRPYGQLREPEIQDFRLPARGNKDIGRLDVAVRDALRVCRIQPVGNLDRQVQQFVDL